MANININIPKVKKQAALLKDASLSLKKNTVKPLTQSNERLASVWTGDSAKTYIKYTNEMISLLQANADDINEIAIFLENSCRSIEKADKQAKTKIRK